MNNFVRDLASVVFSKVAVIAFSLVNSIIIARWLGREVKGTLMALMVYPALLMSLGSLGLTQATTYYLAKGLASEAQAKRAIVHVWCLSSIASLLTCFWLVRYVGESGGRLTLVLLAISPIPFTLFARFIQGLYLGRNDIRGFNRINWIPALVVLLATVVLVVFLDWGLPGAMLAALSAPVFMAVLLAVRHEILQSVSFRVHWQLIRGMLSLGLVYAFALLVINLNYRVDVILMDQLTDDYHIGIYGTGAALTEYLWQIPMLLGTIIFARSATARDDFRFSRRVAQLMRVSLVIVGVASVTLMLLAERVISLLFGNAFLASGMVMRILLPGVVLLTVFKVLNMDLAGKGKPWVSLIAMAPALVLNVALNLAWIPSYGANGAAMASTVSYSLAAVLFLLSYSHVTKLPLREILHFRVADFSPVFQLISGASSRRAV